MNVIGCVNLRTRQWNILEFSSEFPIRTIYGFKEGNLLVHTESNYPKEYQFYKIPFG
jgi:hypothetical protein